MELEKKILVMELDLDYDVVTWISVNFQVVIFTKAMSDITIEENWMKGIQDYFLQLQINLKLSQIKALKKDCQTA